MDLVLWRHAEAEDVHHQRSDDERELTAKGRKQAQKIAAWLQPQLPKETRIVVSPAARTIQTVESLNRIFETSELVSTRGSLSDHLAAARWPADHTALLVGHQPTLGQLAALLMSGHPHHWELKKGAVWWLRSAPEGSDGYATLRVAMLPGMVE